MRSVGGRDVPVRFETVCVHSDTPGADALARALREALHAEGPWPATAH